MSVSDLHTIPQTAETAVEFDDLLIGCMDCEQEFIWSAGEQTFFYDKNLLNPPKRCKQCKKEKIRRIHAVGIQKATGKPQKIEVKAKCAKCSVATTVPFYPSQGRPVYCRACFLEENAANGSNNGANVSS